MAYDFPNAPTVGQTYQGYIWDGLVWKPATTVAGNVRYDMVQALTPAQQTQARNNIAVQKKNYIINGAMMASQQNGSVAGVLTSPYYAVDMFAAIGGGSGAGTAAQVASPTPGGSPNRFRITVTTADATVDPTDYLQLWTQIEGSRMADLRAGSAAAKTVTLQFGVRAPAGLYNVTFFNNAANRYYVAPYTISAGEANIDVVRSITLPLDTTGTWTSDNTRGIDIRWFMMVGSGNITATPNTWSNGTLSGVAGQFNLMGTVGNVFELFDVGLYEGTVAPAFQVPDFPSELQLCRRYWWCSNMGAPKGAAVGTLSGYSINASAIGLSTWRFPVAMRIVPTLTIWNNGVLSQARNSNTGALQSTGGAGSGSPLGVYFSVDGGCNLYCGSTTAGNWLDFDLQADARL